MNWWIYFIFPVVIFVFHYLYFSILFFKKTDRKILVLFNILIYPLIFSLVICFLFNLFTNFEFQNLIICIISGFIGYYISLMLSFVPFIGDVFREIDMEFFLLAVFCVIGFKYSNYSAFAKNFFKLIWSNFVYIGGLTIFSIMFSVLFKVLINRFLAFSQREGEVIKFTILGYSVCAAILVIPVLLFTQKMYGG